VVLGHGLCEGVNCTICHQFALVDDDDTVTDCLNFRQDVGRENNRVSFSEPLNQVSDFHHLFWVKANGWFIENQDGRIANECLCQTDTLPVTFGQILDDAVLHITDFAEVADFSEVCFAGEFALFQVIDEPQVAHNGHFLIEWRFRQVADFPFCLDGIVQNVDVVDQSLSGRRADVTGQHVHCGGFSGTVRP
jgi:hypothetical protein